MSKIPTEGRGNACIFLWLFMSGLEPGALFGAAALYGSMGLFIGREIQFGTFRREFLGVPSGKHDDRFWTAVMVLTLWALFGVGASVWQGDWFEALARFVFWWTGVFFATLLAVRNQMRLERILLAVPWGEDDPHWATARELAKKGTRFEGRIFRSVLAAHGDPTTSNRTDRPSQRPDRRADEEDESMSHLRKRALAMLLGDEATLARLMAYERARAPEESELEMLRRTIERIQRDQS